MILAAAFGAGCNDDLDLGDIDLTGGPKAEARGRAIFRHFTFGDERKWTDLLRLHEVIADAVDPMTALAVGLKVDSDALPPGIGGAMGAAAHLDALQERQIVIWRRLGDGISLRDASKPLAHWPIDWVGLDRRRRGELRKLEMMQKYAYTPTCRRAFTLRYFGDPSARPKCEGCDNCLGIKHEAHVVESPGRNARTKRKVAEDKTKSAGPTSEPLSRAELELVDALRAWRSRQAKDDEVPAYVVFHDATLRDIALRRPSSLDELATVGGVGATKLERYGEGVLATLAD